MDLRKERTLKLLTQAMLDLLHEKPFTNITISEICDRAMVRRPTFYRHFQNKEDLLLYLIRNERLDVQERMLGQDFHTITTPEYALIMTREFLRLAQAHKHLYQAQALNENFANIMTIAADEIGHEFARFLAERAGLDSPTYDQQFLGALYANGLFGALRFWMAVTPEQTEEDFLAAFEPIIKRLFNFDDGALDDEITSDGDHPRVSPITAS